MKHAFTKQMCSCCIFFFEVVLCFYVAIIWIWICWYFFIDIVSTYKFIYLSVSLLLLLLFCVMFLSLLVFDFSFFCVVICIFLRCCSASCSFCCWFLIFLFFSFFLCSYLRIFFHDFVLIILFDLVLLFGVKICCDYFAPFCLLAPLFFESYTPFIAEFNDQQVEYLSEMAATLRSSSDAVAMLAGSYLKAKIQDSSSN